MVTEACQEFHFSTLPTRPSYSDSGYKTTKYMPHKNILGVEVKINILTHAEAWDKNEKNDTPAKHYIYNYHSIK